jgi:hypothetical protein
MQIEVNYLSVFIAAVASMVVGFAWYSPTLFGNQWMKYMGLNMKSIKKAQKEMGSLYMLSFVVALFSAFVLSHVMTMSESYFGYTRLATGITSAFWMWLGFIMPVQVTDTIFGNKKWGLFKINTSYQLASLIAMGIVLGILG